jgi:hypothetical protein
VCTSTSPDDPTSVRELAEEAGVCLLAVGGDIATESGW